MFVTNAVIRCLTEGLAIRRTDPQQQRAAREPLPLNDASAALLGLVRSVARGQGRELPEARAGGAHARGEFIYPDTVPDQIALVAGALSSVAAAVELSSETGVD